MKRGPSGKVRAIPIPVGERFGRLLVRNGPICKGHRSYYECACDCGELRTVRSDALRSGITVSCGCYGREAVAKALTTHGDTIGHKPHRLYTIRAHIIERCCKPNDPSFCNYGGRGITVCSEWRDSYEAFRDWSSSNGYADDLEIDRVDNDGPYSPENCRWTTHAANQRNRRDCWRISAFGETKTLTEWGRDPRSKVSVMALKNRLRAGWEAERAIATPPYARGIRRKGLASL